jgi:hypothetical protein
VHLGLEAHAGHPDRIADSLLAVDDEFLRQHVQDLLVGRDGDRLGRVDHVLDIGGLDFLVADRNHAVRVEAAHVAASDARVDRVDLAAGHQLGFLDGALYRLHRRFDVDHHTALETARRLRADADDLDAAVGRDLSDQDHHFRGADVESDDELSFGFLRHANSVHQPSGLSSSSSTAATLVPPRQPTANPFV